MAPLHLEGQDNDGDFVERLRKLQAQHQAGAISALEFDAAFRALDRAAGTLCRCGRGIRAVRQGRNAVCAQCYLEAR